MSGFISWVEKDGKRFFLTDKEVFSPHGRIVFSDCKDNDVLGHEAIRKYFGKDGAPMQGGVDYKNYDFWNKNKLPLEIAKLISKFDNYWGRIFTSGTFQTDDLRYIIFYAPPEWRDKAWEQCLKQGTSNDDLRCFIFYAPPEWRDKAWEYFLKQGPSNDDLRYIITRAPPEWRDKAREQLVKQCPSTSK